MKKKIIAAFMISFIILGAAIVYTIINSGSKQPESACRLYFDEMVTVKDGEVTLGEETDSYIHRIPFTLYRTSDYRLLAAWDTSANPDALDPGVLTVLLLKDAQENIIAHLSMSSGDSEMNLDDLPAGEYTAEYRYYTDEGEARALLSSLSPEVSPEPEGTLDRYNSFGREGTWVMRHTFVIEEQGLPRRAHYRAGVMFGIGIGFGILIFSISFLIMTLKAGKNAKKTGYDERQQIARGKAFKYGFYTMLAYYMFLYFSSILELSLPLDQGTGEFLGIILGIIPFCCYSVWKDAYFRMEENKTAVIALFALIAAINIFTGIGNLLSGSAFSAEGRLSMGALPLMIGVMFLCLLITGIAKTVKDRREEVE